MINKKYKIILADPPWSYKVWSKKGQGRSAESHYRCMAKEEIKNLPIDNISDNNCVLFLWVTMPCLIEGIELCKAWGFDYKTVGFVWCKRNKKSLSWFWGMGYWTRANAELCLIATKGKISRIAKNVHQIVDTPIQEHSKKPSIVRDRIVSLMGDLPRIELFAREKVDGWDCWGNEVESDINLIAQEKTMKSELLKPCAHCGRDAEHLIMDGWDRIGCKLCGTLGGRCGSKEKAIKAWNTRTGELIPAARTCHRCGQILSDKKSSPVDLRGGERHG